MSLRITVILAVVAASAVAAQTVHSVVVFSRHGDRTAKFYKGYHLTNLGANQVHAAGNYYRQRYVEDGASNQIAGISADEAVPSQIWASAPDQSILYQTATDFLQGLYPPLGGLDSDLANETLVNGTEVEDPLNGYQFILIHGEGTTDPDTIWIKGDEDCPAYTTSYKSYSKTPIYEATLNASAPIYASVEPILAPIMTAENVSYSHAYDVFDLLNVASIHNASVAPEIDADTLNQLRYLANEWEWNNNYNASQPMRSIGGKTLLGRILQQFEENIESEGKKNKFNLLAGSYDTFLAFFGLTNLTAQSDNFYGLPNYAASMAFELSSDSETFPTNPQEDLMVTFLFRNGSDLDLEPYALFGQDQVTLPYGRFVEELSSRAVTSLPQWCAMCGSTADFCVAANATTTESSGSVSTGGPSSSSSGSGGSGLSNAAAGGIGAGVTLAVVGILAGLLCMAMRRRKAAKTAPAAPVWEKRGSDSDISGSPERV
jgi:prostatic aicd phosphatase